MRTRGIQGIASRHGYEVAHTDLALFNMNTDPGEKTNVADQHPDVVARLSKLAKGIRGELGDELTGTKGTEVRLAGNTAVK